MFQKLKKMPTFSHWRIFEIDQFLFPIETAQDNIMTYGMNFRNCYKIYLINKKKFTLYDDDIRHRFNK